MPVILPLSPFFNGSSSLPVSPPSRTTQPASREAPKHANGEGRRRRLLYPGAIRLDTTTKRLIQPSSLLLFITFVVLVVDN